MNFFNHFIFGTNHTIVRLACITNNAIYSELVFLKQGAEPGYQLLTLQMPSPIGFCK
jgi:hypothetical protein